MSGQVIEKLVSVITDAAMPLAHNDNKYDALLDKIGDARFVLMGEATHGTQEFYQARIEISKQLIEKKNFMAIAIEGDWPDVYHIHRYIQGIGHKRDWHEAFAGFKRFPMWMWRNAVLPPFIKWLRNYNDHLSSPATKVGFYGLDLYSLNSSMEAVINYLMMVDPEEAERARVRYACFDHMKIDPQNYGYLVTQGIKKTCIKESVEQLLALQHHAFEYIRHGGMTNEDEFFYAAQNARLVKNAEKYYRSMFEGHVLSWNIRDQHMAETLNVLADHLENRFKKPAKIILWAHNSHVGDARATEVSAQGEVNVGQLVRENHDKDTFLIGFSTNHGTVTAASGWDQPAQRININPGLEGSYEELFHQVKYDNFLLDLQNNKILEHYLQIPRLQRAIGVIYRPETERSSHYFFTRLPYQFDCVIHFDKTTAVEPLDNDEWLQDS